MLVFVVCMNKLLLTYLSPMKSCKMNSLKKHLRELDMDLQPTCKKKRSLVKVVDLLGKAKE